VTIRYALSASESVTAVHVTVDSDEAKQLEHAWQERCRVVPLRIVPSPYREVIDPLVALHRALPGRGA